VVPLTKKSPLTANAKTSKNRNEQILRNAEDAVRREETEDSHKCHLQEGMAKMEVAYKFGTLTTAEAENYYSARKRRNLNCVLVMENNVIDHAKVYISPFMGKFKRLNLFVQGEIILKNIKPKIENIQGYSKLL
jgi:hypothetical protein